MNQNTEEKNEEARVGGKDRTALRVLRHEESMERKRI
jgi:hypothetical protein